MEGIKLGFEIAIGFALLWVVFVVFGVVVSIVSELNK
jgi:hypothetical protein